MRPLVLILALGTLGACIPLDRDPGLHQFDDCDDLHVYMARMAYLEVRDGWGSDFQFGFGGKAEMDIAMDDGGDGGRSATETSETNVQEEGVDEADLVKTDGTYLYSLAGGDLVISRAFPTDEAEQLSVTSVDGRAEGLYLVDDDVIVMSSLWWEEPEPLSGAEVSWDEYTTTLMTVVDVSDPTAPEVTRETYATGRLETSRRIDDKLYIVTYRDVDVATEADSKREAKDMVREADPEEWLTDGFDNQRDEEGWDSEEGTLCGCEDVWASDREGGTFISTVMVLDLTDPLSAFVGSAVVGRADVVYASQEAIWLGYAEWEDGPFGTSGALDTVLHKFDITGGEPSYVGTTEVPGVIHDRFSLSDRDGVLRIATTDQSDWTTGVYTIEEDGGVFTELDRIDGLAPDEQIMSARFVGDLGYVVTWEVFLGDPLFTFDFSDPSDIVLGGELHIPGWSDYLHPMDEDHLLAVGIDGTLQVSLFDISDFENPALQDRLFLDAWGSEAQWEPHAFNYFPPTESLSMPVSDYDDIALQVVHADAEGLGDLGKLYQPEEMLYDTDAWCAPIRRSVVMDEVVWAVSSAGLTAAAVADPTTVVASVDFTGVDPCADEYYDYYYYW